MSVRTSTRVVRARVIAVRHLTPRMVRVTLGGPELADYPTTGVGDEYVRVFFPRESSADRPGELTLPVVTGDTWAYEPGVDPCPMRTYTIRAHRLGQLDIDFALHASGVGSSWAQTARPGDEVGLTTPTGLFNRRPDAWCQVILADATGLPAATRIIENLPADVPVRAVFEVTGPEEIQAMPVREGLDVCWKFCGNGASTSCLLDELRDLDIPDDSHVWVAGDTASTRRCRSYLRHDRGLPADRYKVIGYWVPRAEEWEKRYDSVGAETKAELAALWESGQDEETIIDEYTARLEALGL